MLDWSENFQSNPVTEFHVTTLRNSPWVRQSDPEKLSTDLWAYLNLALAGAKDRSAFDNAECGNGFDAWQCGTT